MHTMRLCVNGCAVYTHTHAIKLAAQGAGQESELCVACNANLALVSLELQQPVAALAYAEMVLRVRKRGVGALELAWGCA
jgi:hypothetical protein